MSKNEFKYISYHKQKSDVWLDIITKCKAREISWKQYEWLAAGFEINPRNKSVDTSNFTLV